MKQIYVSFCDEDHNYSLSIVAAAKEQGFLAVHRLEQGFFPYHKIVRDMEMKIRGSAAVVLIWSENANKTDSVKDELIYSRKLLKPLFAVCLDDEIPRLGSRPLAIEKCFKLEELVDISKVLFNQSNRSKAYFEILDMLSHDHLSMRLEGVRLAAQHLKNEELQSEILVLLEEVGEKDSYLAVNQEAQRQVSLFRSYIPSSSPKIEHLPDYVVIVDCYSCGHLNRYDKRIICKKSGSFVRRTVAAKAGKETDDIYLMCQNCEKDVIASIDCGGYK